MSKYDLYRNTICKDNDNDYIILFRDEESAKIVFKDEESAKIVFDEFNQKDQRIAELEKQLENAIVPKFKICNKCKKPIDMSKKCVHFLISHGERAIESKGQYGDKLDADLCEECADKILPLIDDYYFGGNKNLKESKND